MTAASTVLVINASLTLLEELLPKLSQLKASGEITAEQQAAVLAKYTSLKTRADGQFAGPEWQVEPPSR
jgi:hypothetical protein